MERLSDTALLRQIRKGNQSAFIVLMKRKTKMLYRAAFMILQDVPLAEDAVLTTFTELSTKYEQIRNNKALNGWLMTALRRNSFDILRKRKRALIMDPDVVISYIDRQHNQATDTCEIIHIYNCLSELHKLDPRQYEALSLHYQGLTLKEIMRIMSTTKSQTETLIKNARNNFKKFYFA